MKCFWHTIRPALRLTWKSLAAHPQVTVEEAMTMTVNARSDLGRLGIGISPSQLVLSRRPKRLKGDDLDGDEDARLFSDKSFAGDHAAFCSSACRSALLRFAIGEVLDARLVAQQSVNRRRRPCNLSLMSYLQLLRLSQRASLSQLPYRHAGAFRTYTFSSREQREAFL